MVARAFHSGTGIRAGFGHKHGASKTGTGVKDTWADAVTKCSLWRAAYVLKIIPRNDDEK